MNNNLSLQPSAYEQYMLELINRARSNPNAEAALYSLTDLNQGLSPGTITSDPKQPLAFNLFLIDSAREHSQWMGDTNTFSHTGEGGSNAGQRMSAAGYNFTGSWGWGENIALQSTKGTPNVSQFIAEEHEDLFQSDGHRKNILKDSFREIGIGVIKDTFNNYNAVITTQNFADSGSSVFLTGVAFDDLVIDDDFYTIGEGIGGISLKATRQSDNQIFTTNTMDAGGYQIALTTGNYDIEFFQNGTKIGNTHSVTINSQNVKLDLDISNLVDIQATNSISPPALTPTIDIYSDLNTPIYRFQSNSMPGTYLFVGEEERLNIYQNFANSFTEEGIGFYATTAPSDGLVPLYRFQSKAVPGTYLFTGEEEKQSINENFSETFNYEGIAFYVHPMGSGEETTYARFQNSLVPGTYLYATGAEADNIRLNYTNFLEEGGAFEARI